MKYRILVILAAFAALGWGWPPIRPTYFHAATKKDVEDRKAYWFANGHFVHKVVCCGSMRPHIQTGDFIASRLYLNNEPLPLGTIITFEKDGQKVTHSIVSQNKRAFYISGTANQYSDGWVPKERVIFVAVEIIRGPK